MMLASYSCIIIRSMGPIVMFNNNHPKTGNDPPLPALIFSFPPTYLPYLNLL